MQNDWEAGQLFRHFSEDVKAQLRLLTGLELICTMACADGDGEGVNARAGYEILHLFRLGEIRIVGRNIDVIFNACQLTKLALYHNAMRMRILDDLAGELHILLIRLGGAIDHNGSKAAVNAAFAGFKIRAVIQMQSDRKAGFGHRCLDHLHQIVVMRILARAGGDLQNNGRIELFACARDALNDLHVVYIEGADGIAVVIGLFEHFSGSYQWHRKHSLYFILQRHK